MRVRPSFITAVVLACLSGLVAAQVSGVQRIVGPDGRVTYTDQPGNSAPAASVVAPANGNASTAWPLALRQTVQRYPVTLYSGNNCAPCDNARELLVRRGIPFTEKTVTTSEDAQAFARLSRENTLPLLTIGTQQVVGFQAIDIARYLDAAGYPSQSQLPRNHRQPPAQPLAGAAPSASPSTTDAPAAAAVGAPPVAPSVAPSGAPSVAPSGAPAPTGAPVQAPPPANPAGIRF